MHENVDRLLRKAEAAIDNDNLAQGDAYRILATQTNYLHRQQARDLNKLYKQQPQESRQP